MWSLQETTAAAKSWNRKSVACRAHSVRNTRHRICFHQLKYTEEENSSKLSSAADAREQPRCHRCSKHGTVMVDQHLAKLSCWEEEEDVWESLWVTQKHTDLVSPHCTSVTP